MENRITEKQQNYLLKLDPTLTAEQLKDYTVKMAGILIAQLKKKTTKKNTKTATVENFAHGYKTGDILYASWGYDQTNLDFFKVVKATEHSVRVVEVSMKQTEESGIGFMSRNVAYDPATATPLEKSFFVSEEGQKSGKGDLLRIGTYEHNGQKNYYLNIGRGRYGLYKYTGQKLYESWYA